MDKAAFDGAHGEFHGKPALQDREIRRRGKDLLAVYSAIDRMGHVVRDDLHPPFKAPRAQQRHRGFGGGRGPDDIVEIGNFLQGLLDQQNLILAACIAVFGHRDLG